MSKYIITDLSERLLHGDGSGSLVWGAETDPENFLTTKTLSIYSHLEATVKVAHIEVAVRCPSITASGPEGDR